jgi:hypothetical protein
MLYGRGDPTSALLRHQFFDARDPPLTPRDRAGARYRRVQTLRGTAQVYDPRGNALRGWARAGHSLAQLRPTQRPGGVLPPTHPFAKTYLGTPHRVTNLRQLGKPLPHLESAPAVDPISTPGRPDVDGPPPPPKHPGPTHVIQRPGFDWTGEALSTARDLLGPVVKKKAGELGGRLVDAILKPDPDGSSSSRELQMEDLDAIEGSHDDGAHVPITWWDTGDVAPTRPRAPSSSVGHYPLVPPDTDPAVVYPSVPPPHPHRRPSSGASLPTPSPSPPPLPVSHSVGLQATSTGADVGVQAGAGVAPAPTSGVHTQTESPFGPHELDLIFAHPHAFEHMVAQIHLAHADAQRLRAELQTRFDAERSVLYTQARQALRHALAAAGVDPDTLPDTLSNEQALAIIADAVPDMARDLVELRRRAHTASLHETHTADRGTQTLARPNPLLRHLLPAPASKHARDDEGDEEPGPPGRRPRVRGRALRPPPLRTQNLPTPFNYDDLDWNQHYRVLSPAQRAYRRRTPRELRHAHETAQTAAARAQHPRARQDVHGRWHRSRPVGGGREVHEPLEHLDHAV